MKSFISTVTIYSTSSTAGLELCVPGSTNVIPVKVFLYHRNTE